MSLCLYLFLQINPILAAWNPKDSKPYLTPGQDANTNCPAGEKDEQGRDCPASNEVAEISAVSFGGIAGLVVAGLVILSLFAYFCIRKKQHRTLGTHFEEDIA